MGVVDSRLDRGLVVGRPVACCTALLDRERTGLGQEAEDAAVGAAQDETRVGGEQGLVAKRVGNVARSAYPAGRMARALEIERIAGGVPGSEIVEERGRTLGVAVGERERLQCERAHCASL